MQGSLVHSLMGAGEGSPLEEQLGSLGGAGPYVAEVGYGEVGGRRAGGDSDCEETDGQPAGEEDMWYDTIVWAQHVLSPHSGSEYGFDSLLVNLPLRDYNARADEQDDAGEGEGVEEGPWTGAVAKEDEGPLVEIGVWNRAGDLGPCGGFHHEVQWCLLGRDLFV